jgi:hypothetical protein
MRRLMIVSMMCMVGIVLGEFASNEGSESQQVDQQFNQSCDPRYNAC